MFSYVIDKKAKYTEPPCNPTANYPELNALPWCSKTDPENRTYDLFRQMLMEAGFDKDNQGTDKWNPLEQMLGNANNIVIKPNLVIHKVKEMKCSIEGLVVHASVLRPLLDYLLLASKRTEHNVRITVADTPIQSADFKSMCTGNGFIELLDFYRQSGQDIPLLDLRKEQAIINDRFLILHRKPLPGDPAGVREVDLGTSSYHYRPDEPDIIYSIQDFDASVTNYNHFGETHRYGFAQSILDADLIINICKLKSHRMAGVTLSLKNIVGANISKDYLPHYRPGGPAEGGDEFSTNSYYKNLVRNVREFFNRKARAFLSPVHRVMKSFAHFIERRKGELGWDTVYYGAWYGNNTLWRTIADINTVLYYADNEGRLHDSRQRRQVCIADGIVGMEGNGPTKGTDIHAGVLAYGDDPVEFDAKLTYLMGFDPDKLKHIAHWKEKGPHHIGLFPENVKQEMEPCPNLGFLEPSGWKGRMGKR